MHFCEEHKIRKNVVLSMRHLFNLICFFYVFPPFCVPGVFNITVLLFEFKCPCIELIVGAFLRNKLLVISALDYSTVVKNHDHVGVHNR